MYIFNPIVYHRLPIWSALQGYGLSQRFPISRSWASLFEIMPANLSILPPHRNFSLCVVLNIHLLSVLRTCLAQAHCLQDYQLLLYSLIHSASFLWLNVTPIIFVPLWAVFSLIWPQFFFVILAVSVARWIQWVSIFHFRDRSNFERHDLRISL